MTPVSDIFDRKRELTAIESDCLGPQCTSGVLLCSQKVGKSYLLDHIFARKDRPDLIFCRINPDMLWAQRPKDELLDKAFFDHLLRRLLAELENWVDSRTELEAGWSAQVERLNRQLTSLVDRVDKESAEVRKALEEDLKAFSASANELKRLRKVSANIADLLALPEARAEDLISKVANQLWVLRGLQKRVVLFIDDFHRIVGERAFSNAVFSFLRAANNDRTIITIATSTTDLMDDSLHYGDEERSRLFNQFRPQVLKPFNDTEVDAFLDWLSRGGRALSGDEKAYLRELGGGTPFFVREAHDRFVREEWPTPGERREEMERDLATSFKGPFTEIWLRCSGRRQELLREIAESGRASSTADVDYLADDGFVVDKNTGRQLFSRLFADFIKLQPPRASGGVSVTASVLRIFTTALTFARPDAALVTFYLRNPTKLKVEIRLSCELKGFSDQARQMVTLAPGERQVREFPVVLQDGPVRTLTNPRYATVAFFAEQMGGGKSPRVLTDGTSQVLVLPKDNFMFARRDEHRNLLVDFTWLIAAWVRKVDEAFDPIKREARNLHPLHRFTGYEENDPEAVRKQVEVIYEALKNHGFDYDNSALVFHQERDDFIQRVRLPAQVLREKGGNCLEGCVLFASLLSAVDLHPVILFIAGHAIVGWRVRDEETSEWSFLETTVIATEPFSVACQLGDAKYEIYRTLCDEWRARPRTEIRTSLRFAIPVDIHHVLSTMRLVPIPA